MEILIELSGEHQRLPFAEVIACLEAERISCKLIERSTAIAVLAVNRNPVRILTKRLALAHNIDEFVQSSTKLSDVKRAVADLKLRGSFAVRVKRIRGMMPGIHSLPLERKLGSLVNAKKVDLRSPDNEIRVLLADKFYVGIKRAEINRAGFDARKVQHRPFFSPISLHPHISRTMVNLSRIRKGELLADPFCGTGGILLEAGLVGARLLGGDIDKKMVAGCRINLAHFKLNAELEQKDARELLAARSGLDAVVTDPPYGRAASTFDLRPYELYDEVLAAAKDAVKYSGYLVITFPEQKFVRLGERYFVLAEHYSMRVHKSLVRHICVYRNLKS